jgi:hypothetical protein
VVHALIDKKMTAPNENEASTPASLRKKPKWGSYLKYSLIAYAILSFGACVGPFATTGPGDSLANYSMSSAFAVSLGVLISSGVISIIIALIVAGIASSAFKKSFSTWLHGVYVALILGFASLVCFADLSGINKHGRDKININRMEINESGLWISMNLFRINLLLPETPKVTKVSAPIETRHLIKGGHYDQAMIKNSDHEVVVVRIERNSSPIDLEEIRTGSITDIRNLAVASNVHSNTGEMSITNHDALWSEVFYTIDGREWCARTLIFADGGTLWMVTVTGDGVRTSGMWHKIKNSVSVGSL